MNNVDQFNDPAKEKNFQKYSDGFSFTVDDELSAYKWAYRYKYCLNVIVRETPQDGFLVQVYA